MSERERERKLNEMEYVDYMEYTNADSVAGNEDTGDADSGEVTSDIRLNDISDGQNEIVVVVGSEDETPPTADHGEGNNNDQVKNNDNDIDYDVVDVNRLYASPSVSGSSDLRRVLERTRTGSIDRFFHEENPDMAYTKEASPFRSPQSRRGTPIEVKADNDSKAAGLVTAVPYRQHHQELRQRRRRRGTQHHSNEQDGNTPIQRDNSTRNNFRVHVNDDGVVEVGGEDDDDNDDENPTAADDGTDTSEDDDDDDDDDTDTSDDDDGSDSERMARRKAKSMVDVDNHGGAS